jgi:hypothetical protein
LKHNNYWNSLKRILDDYYLIKTQNEQV